MAGSSPVPLAWVLVFDSAAVAVYFGPMPTGYLERILRAPVYDVAEETPLVVAPRLSAALNHQVWIKREDLQPVFSFKLRGAYTKMSQLSTEERKRGVIAASAGNHAQGIAISAQLLDVSAIVVMPTTTPRIKVDAVTSRGAKAVLAGDTFDEAFAHAQGLAKTEKRVFIHPFDDPDVIAGQGTVALEIFRQHRGKIDCIFVPVGGGGLIAGIGVYAKHVHPNTRIIGVEPADSACMGAAFKAGKPVALDTVGIFADGVAVRQVGDETFRLAQECVDEMIVVDTDEICAAIKDLFEDTRSIAEPAGALGLAGLKRYVAQHGGSGQTLVAIESGANMNFDRLRHVAERSDFSERKEALLGVSIPEKKGSFLRFCQTLGALPITEFNYRFKAAQQAHIFVGVGLTGGLDEVTAITRRLVSGGLEVIDMTDNEAAKLHLRYMVGGRADTAFERLVRFEFPERPGALLRFLSAMGDRWNISLFHYRNQGAAFGRVLAGIQVPPEENEAFARFIEDIGYGAIEETDNPAYALFLQ